MANQLFAYAKYLFATGQLNWLGDNMKACFLNPSFQGGFTAISTYQFYPSISPYILTGSQSITTITGKTAVVSGANAIMSAVPVAPATVAMVQFISLAAGQVCSYLAIFKDPDPTNINGPPASGNQASSPLIALLDSGAFVSQGTNGGNYDVPWDARGIFEF